MGFSSQKSLLAVVLTHGSVAGFSAQRFGPLRPRAALHPLHQPRTVANAGAIDLAANATKGLVEGVVRTVTDNDEYQFGDLTKGVVRDLTGKDASEYKFGDITKTAVKNFTGKDEYEVTRTPPHTAQRLSSSAHCFLILASVCPVAQFGDITKKLGQMMFGNKDVKKKEK